MKIDSAKIIFFHPGKTGGTSIEHTLKDIYLDKDLKLDANNARKDIMFGIDREIHIYLQHACIRLYDNLGIKFKEYKTIATVRRPYERILSCYYYNGKSKKFTFEEFVTTNLEVCLALNERYQYAVSHFAPQHYYTHYNDYVVDNIIKLENFKDDCAKAGLDVKYHHSKTKGTMRFKNYMDAYTQKTKDIVYNLYKEDFDKYGYDK